MEASSGVLAEINPTAQQPRSIRRSAYDVELIDRADNTWLVVLQQTVHHMQNFHPGEKRTCGILVSPAVMGLSLIHISEPTRPCGTSRMPSSA